MSEEMQADEIKRAAEKIAKLLALATSDNVHEADNAKRQADALMRKYNLTKAYIDASKVRLTHSKKQSKANRPPRYLMILAAVIAEAFACESIAYSGMSGQFMVFLGVGHKPDLASYVYDVLRCQLVKDRQSYKKTLYRYKKSNQVKLCDLFCESWVHRVSTQVTDFAASKEEKSAVNSYMEINHPDVKQDSRKARYDSMSGIGVNDAVISGMRAAKDVSIYRPVTSKKTQLLDQHNTIQVMYGI